ncbi:MAG: hypothetical protein ACJ8AT_29345 [Hyalangium sp.]|uniref:wHTH domain-containing protein n=1 Tax=Hyalangium sp. TaxID=2028555 RepID=UPI00389B1CBD
MGLITFRQGVEGNRPFIECTDNGVGMTEYDLERVFAVAGRRFVHTPEYIEERAAWSKLGIELYPNSQFGIGVLSYFMLADELQVTTRRFRQDGRFGQLLDARISSASGLFRLTEQEGTDLPEGGTRVRLYLGESRNSSAREILGELLCVAEFRTEVHDGKGPPLIWQAGILGTEADYLLVDDGYIWLNADKPEGSVLADGIVTSERHPLVTVNLHGKHYPHLSVDRRDIIEGWEIDLPRQALEWGIGRMAKWQGMSMQLLWEMEEHYPKTTSQLFSILVDSHAAIPPRPHVKAKVEPGHIGCFLWDALVGLDYWKERNPGPRALNAVERWRIELLEEAGLIQPNKLKPLARKSELKHLLAQPGDALLLYKLRVSRDPFSEQVEKDLGFLDETIEFTTLCEVAFSYGYELKFLLDHLEHYKPLGVQASPTLLSNHTRHSLTNIQAEDWQILATSLKQHDRQGRSVHAWDVLRTASLLKRSIQEVARRLSELAPVANLQLQFKPEALEKVQLKEGDLQLLPSQHEENEFWLNGTVLAMDVLQLAQRLGRLPHEVARRLSELAPAAELHLAFAPEVFEQVEFQAGDLQLLSWNLNGRAPWLEGMVHMTHVLRAAQTLERLPQDVARRLLELASLTGLQLDFRPELLAGLELKEADWQLLSRDVDGVAPWLEGTVHLQDVLRAASKLNRSHQDVVRRLSELAPLAGFQIDSKVQALEKLELQEIDLKLLSRDLDGKPPWLQRSVSLWHAIRASSLLRLSLQKAAHRLSELASLANLQLDFKPENLGRIKLTQGDEQILSPGSGKHASWRDGTVYIWDVLRRASNLRRSPQEVARRFAELAPLAGLQLGFAPDAFVNSALHEVDLQDLASLAEFFALAQRNHDDTMAKARFRLWWLTDEQVEQLLILLMPLFATKLASEPLQNT